MTDIPQGLWLPPRTATFVVAASDSSGRMRAQADYVCDGVDDQVEIQAAIDALPAGGGKVVLSEGTFEVAEEAVYGVDFTDVEGVGPSTIIHFTGENTAFDCSKDHCSLKNLRIDLADATVSAMPIPGFVYFHDNFHSLIDRIHIGPQTRLINGIDANDIKVQNCYLHGGSSALRFYGVVGGLVENNTIEVGNSYGILVEHSGWGNLYAGAGRRCTDIIVNNNHIVAVATAYNNIAIYGDTERFTVSNNICYHAGGHNCISVGSPASYGSCVGNTVLGPGSGTAEVGEGGIEIQNGHDMTGTALDQKSIHVTVGNNVINGFNIGIDISKSRGNLENIIVQGNVVKDCLYGLKMSAHDFDVEDIQIIGNNIEDAECGVYVHNAGDMQVVGNILKNVSVNGIYIYRILGGKTHLLKDNYITGTGTDAYGIRCLDTTFAGGSAGDNLSIEGNTILSCKESIEVSLSEGSDFTKVLNNKIIPGSVGHYAIKLLAAVSDVENVEVSGNFVDNTNLADFGIIFLAVYGFDLANVSIMNNVVKNSKYGGGILLSGGNWRHVTITGNRCYDDQGVKTQDYGLGFDSDMVLLEDTIISHNDFSGNQLGGILLDVDILTRVMMYNQHSDLFMDVLAVSATHIRSNENLGIGIPLTFTIDAQPDVPRTLSGHFDAHVNIAAYTIEITGVDAKGDTITETKTDADGWDWETDNAFATITSIIMTARTGTGVGDTMDIGITDVLGLSNIIYATDDVYKIKKNNANQTVAGAQVNTTYATYDMAVIGLVGDDDFTIWSRSNLNIVD